MLIAIMTLSIGFRVGPRPLFGLTFGLAVLLGCALRGRFLLDDSHGLSVHALREGVVVTRACHHVAPWPTSRR